MPNQEQLQILQQSVEAWNQWRSQNEGIRPDLTQADFHKMNLQTADLSDTNLREANLSEANLASTDFSRADLTNVNLTEAYLWGATLTRAILTGASLARAELIHTTFAGAILSDTDLLGAYFLHTTLVRADFSGAGLSETVFINTDLTDVRGLESCIHLGPSVLDHRTLAKSGPLPLAFLRGCGLPEALIEYLPSILGEPFQFYSCFISYSSADEAFCRRLHGRLQDTGLRVWFAPHDIQGGRKLHEQIDQAIRVYDKLLLVLSPHSMQSPWVEFEIRRARRREVAEQRRLLFPVRLVDYEAIKTWECFDADTAKDLATEIREYYIPDFTAWKDHDAFEVAVGRLLRDLKVAERQPEGSQPVG